MTRKDSKLQLPMFELSTAGCWANKKKKKKNLYEKYRDNVPRDHDGRDFENNLIKKILLGNRHLHGIARYGTRKPRDLPRFHGTFLHGTGTSAFARYGIGTVNICTLVQA